MPVIELVGVAKRFPNGVPAVVGVDLEVKAGELVALVGPSGSGKSTLLRLIAGLEEPTAGTIRIGGVDLAGKPPRDRDVAMVFQEPALYSYLSVADNLAFGLRGRGVAGPEVKSRVRRVAETLKIEGVLDRRPGTLSGGQQRRVALGRALARRPAVYLLDEPLTGLDVPLRAALRGDLIEPLRRTGAAILYVTHDQADALALGDRVAVVDAGRIVQVGRPSRLYLEPATAFVGGFLGSPPMNLIACEAVGRGEDGKGVLRLAGPTPQTRFPVDAAVFEAVTASGNRVVQLGIRPEHTRLAPAGTAPDPPFTWFAADFEIVRVEYLGHEAVVAAARDRHRFLARTEPAATWTPGAAVRVGVDLTRASWFDGNTGRALTPRCPVSDSGIV